MVLASVEQPEPLGITHDESSLVEYGLAHIGDSNAEFEFMGARRQFLADCVAQSIEPGQSTGRILLPEAIADSVLQAVKYALKSPHGPVRSILDAEPPYRHGSIDRMRAKRQKEIAKELINRLETADTGTVRPPVLKVV